MVDRIQKLPIECLAPLSVPGNYLNGAGEVIPGSSKQALARRDLFSFRDMVLLHQNAMADLQAQPQHAVHASSCLKWMVAHKQAHYIARYAITRLVLTILDCLRNYFSGHGFRTTEEIARSLCTRLDEIKVPPPSTPEIPPAPVASVETVTTTIPVPPTATTTAVTPSQVPPPAQKEPPSPKPLPPIPKGAFINKFKRQSLQLYWDQPSACPDIEKRRVFSLDLTKKDIKDPLTTIEGLIEYFCELKQIDLNDPNAQRVLLDIIEVQGHAVIDSILRDWLLPKKPPFTIVSACFQLLIEKKQNNVPTSYEALEALLLYNKKEHLDKKLHFTPEDSTLITALMILIEERPTFTIEQHIDWCCKHPSFTLATWASLMAFYVQREQSKSEGRGIAYGGRDILMLAFQQNKKWEEGLKELALSNRDAHTILEYWNGPQQEDKPIAKWVPLSQRAPRVVAHASEPREIKPVVWVPTPVVKARLDRIKSGEYPGNDLKAIVLDFTIQAKRDRDQAQYQMIGILQYLSDSPSMGEIDVNHPHLAVFLGNIFSLRTDQLSDFLADWLVEQPIETNLLNKCLEGLSLHPISTQSAAMTTFFKFLHRKPLLSFSDPILHKAVARQLEKDPEETLLKVSGWIVNHPTCNLDMLLAMGQVYYDRLQLHPGTPYSVLAIIREAISGREEWIVELNQRKNIPEHLKDLLRPPRRTI